MNRADAVKAISEIMSLNGDAVLVAPEFTFNHKLSAEDIAHYLHWLKRQRTVPILTSFGADNTEEDIAALVRELFVPVGPATDVHFESYNFLSLLNFQEEEMSLARKLYSAVGIVVEELRQMLPYQVYEAEEEYYSPIPTGTRVIVYVRPSSLNQ